MVHVSDGRGLSSASFYLRKCLCASQLVCLPINFTAVEDFVPNMSVLANRLQIGSANSLLCLLHLRQKSTTALFRGISLTLAFKVTCSSKNQWPELTAVTMVTVFPKDSVFVASAISVSRENSATEVLRSSTRVVAAICRFWKKTNFEKGNYLKSWWLYCKLRILLQCHSV